MSLLERGRRWRWRLLGGEPCTCTGSLTKAAWPPGRNPLPPLKARTDARPMPGPTACFTWKVEETDSLAIT